MTYIPVMCYLNKVNEQTILHQSVIALLIVCHKMVKKVSKK